MSKHFNLNTIAFFFSVFFLISSCKDDNTTTTDSDTAASTTTVTSTDASPATTAPAGRALTGTLDNLYIGRKAFTDLPNGTKLVFSHTFASDEKVHLDGWILRPGNKFDTNPNMKLENGDPSTTNYGSGIYFGNLVLQANDFNKIKRALERDANFTFVVFLPKKIDTYFIGYEVYVSVAKPFTLTPGLAATALLNPSPPKDY